MSQGCRKVRKDGETMIDEEMPSLPTQALKEGSRIVPKSEEVEGDVQPIG